LKHNNRLVLVYAIILPSISCSVKYIITKINDVYSHGDVWVGKVKRIRHKLPKQTLFAIDGNTHAKAISEISGELEKQDIIVQPYNTDNIRLFAIQ